MSAANRHVVEVTGKTLREISEDALALFDVFFAREIDWQVVRFETHAERTDVRAGTGEQIAETILWRAVVEAEASGIQIGAAKHQHAMLFRPLGS